MTFPLTHRAAAWLFLLALGFLLTSCAAPRSEFSGWKNPRLPRERLGIDIEICRQAAARDVEEKYIRNTIYMGREEEERYTYQGRMKRYDMIIKRDALTARCLRAKGYRPASDKGYRPASDKSYRPASKGDGNGGQKKVSPR